ERNPGTIWGFEDIRMPFVQAAHETAKGDQPLRMMELWKAVEESLSVKGYGKLLDNPEEAADEYAEYGASLLDKNTSKTYIENFKKDAKAYLLEFAAQMPKGTFARDKLEGRGKKRVSEAAGIIPGKFMGGLACKAGLWWAKKEKKPVYYCLDGVDMDDVA